MIEIPVKFFGIYACQVCQKEFRSKKDLIVVKNITPVCSNRCFFKVVYKIISQYDNNGLQGLHSALEMPNYCKIPKNEQIYEYCKKLVNKLLSSGNEYLLITQKGV